MTFLVIFPILELGSTQEASLGFKICGPKTLLYALRMW